MSAASKKPRWGLFGGTFDPPHLGHLAAARAVRDALGLDKVVLMVAGEPWQKMGQKTQPMPGSRDDISSGDLRVEMVRALIEGEPGLEVGDDEVRRGGPTYTVDTLRAMRDEHPDVDVYLVLGADAAARLDSWREPAEVLALSTLVVVSRAGSERPVIPFGSVAEWVEMEPVAVSSSEIRERVAAGEAPEGTSEAVAHIIMRHGLYRGRR